MTRDQLAVIVAAVITVVWVGSIVIDAIPSVPYDPPPTIHPLMLLAAGYLFGTGIFKSGK